MCGVRQQLDTGVGQQQLHNAPQTLPLSMPLMAAHAEQTAYVAIVKDSYAPPPVATRGGCGVQEMPDGREGLLTIVSGQQVRVCVWSTGVCQQCVSTGVCQQCV